MTTRVLLIDDERKVLNGLTRTLRDAQPDWEVATATSVDEALSQMHQSNVDVALSDINMPGKDGFALLKLMQSDERTKDIPVIMLTGRGRSDDKRRALELGAVDLLSKPVDSEDLLARFRSALRLKAYQDQLRIQNAELERMVAERTRELAESRMDIIWRLGKAGEHRDEHTGNHVVRVGCYCRVLARSLDLGDDLVEMLFLASPLHDIGKIAVPDSILRKPGRLTPDEWAVMKTHCAIGAEILRDESRAMLVYRSLYGRSQAGALAHIENPILKLASVIALTHHEWWNGKGYPAGLSEERIPLASRIVALADTYDALRSERPYKRAFSEAETIEIIRSENGSHLDPRVVAAFDRSVRELEAIGAEFAEPCRLPLERVA